MVNLKKVNIACFKKNRDEKMKLHKQFMDEIIAEADYCAGFTSGRHR